MPAVSIELGLARMFGETLGKDLDGLVVVPKIGQPAPNPDQGFEVFGIRGEIFSSGCQKLLLLAQKVLW